MKNFTKSDLRTGDIIVTKEKGNVILIGNRFKKFEHLNNIKGVTNINNYNDMLEEDAQVDNKCTIEKVYRIKSGYDYSLKEIIEKLPETNVELVWEREESKREIDWNKVPEFTRVLVRDNEKDKWKKGYFLYYNETLTHPYVITCHGKFTYEEGYYCGGYKQIKIFDENDIKEEWCK